MLQTQLPKIFLRKVQRCESEVVESFLPASPFHSIHLIVPNAVQQLHSIHQILDPAENSYVIVQKVPLSSLLEESFLSSFVRKGSLWVLTEEGDGIFEKSVSIHPPGKLLLSVTRNFYQKLGIHGSLCTSHLQQDDRYEISIDLSSPLCMPGRKDYDVVFAKFQKNELYFNIILKWIPTDLLTCCTSIADYFLSRGLDCRVCESQCASSVTRSAPVPTLDFYKPFDKNLETCSAEDVLEWIGAQACDVQWVENQESSRNVVFPHPAKKSPFFYGHWKGMFAPVIVNDLLSEMSKILEMEKSIPYAVVFAHGFQDSWKENNNSDLTDNKISCIVIFQESKCWLLRS